MHSGYEKKIICHYTQRGSNVYMCSLDAPKAFDKVHFAKLFQLLLKQNIPIIVLRLVLNIFIRLRVTATWIFKKSYSFNVINVVRQCELPSPVLFNVYFDELLQRLKQNDIVKDILDSQNHFIHFVSNPYLEGITITTSSVFNRKNLNAKRYWVYR